MVQYDMILGKQLNLSALGLSVLQMILKSHWFFIAEKVQDWDWSWELDPKIWPGYGGKTGKNIWGLNV